MARSYRKLVMDLRLFHPSLPDNRPFRAVRPDYTQMLPLLPPLGLKMSDNRSFPFRPVKTSAFHCLRPSLLSLLVLAAWMPGTAVAARSPKLGDLELDKSQLKLETPATLGQTPPPFDPIPDSPRPEPDLRPLPPPDELLEPSGPDEIPDADSLETVPGTIDVRGYNVVGSTVFSQADFDELLAPYTGEVSFAQLLQARSAVTQYYTDQGYITSGALIPPQTLEAGVVEIQGVEGGLEEIIVTGNDRLNTSYVTSRLERATEAPLNVDNLLEALQLLQLDPLIENLSAELSAGSRPGLNLLELTVTEADTFHVDLEVNNGRSPSVGSFRRLARVTEENLLGLGDTISLSYTNTDGSNEGDFRYSVPINPNNGTISLGVGITSSEIIEEPFDELDIEADSRDIELAYRQPIVRTPTREVALGISAARRESDTSLLGVDFPLSIGANDDGETRVSSLRFFQEFTQRGSEQVFAARSQFNLGVGAFDATVNSTEPDSRFLSWRGQFQYLRLLAPETIFLVRSDLQLSTTSLVPLEQFGVGGIDSVRGYRQDTLLTDSGIFASAELRYPLWRTRDREGVLQVVPFLDFGTAWNVGDEDDRAEPEEDALLSFGIGLLFELGDDLSARIDWGIPLVDVEERDDESLQEEGIYFRVRWRPF